MVLSGLSGYVGLNCSENLKVVHLIKFLVSLMLFQLKNYFHALKCPLQLRILIQMDHFHSRCYLKSILVLSNVALMC